MQIDQMDRLMPTNTCSEMLMRMYQVRMNQMLMNKMWMKMRTRLQIQT